jgi:hypothetical protein
MKIDCLMGTYGRYALACESLACFLQQTAVSDATLLIYNQHPKPLFFDHPRVRVVNEIIGNVGLRHIKQRMLGLADPSADLIHYWDDDDLYLPWHLQDTLAHIGDSAAWKPEKSWMWSGDRDFSLDFNYFEGSWTFNAQYLRAAPIDTHPVYSDHPVYRQVDEAGLLAMTDLGDFANYIYRWHFNGNQHLSAYPFEDESDQAANIARWRAGSTDVRNGGVLVPADLRPRWRVFVAGIKDKVAPQNLVEIKRRLGLEGWDENQLPFKKTARWHRYATGVLARARERIRMR